ncbi:Major facilitator superfamily protein [Perilla frutescens var. hirtella]|uniref:Major facilitator superfamily protein n=1 Tax=Perilla frutescens var. hirtella TaxID=608512 RepID=A0AAD4JQT5_PERFH|nr:Major facilitator superfamily protein [Perilla frutescens var. hirtella]
MEKSVGNEVSATKKEPNYRGVRAMPFVIGNETFEKLGTIGTSSNLLVYLTTVFNMKSITATNVINIFNGTCNFGTLLGAFLSDTYLGRYKTLGIASISSFLGMLVLTMTATFPNLHPPKCGSDESVECVGASTAQLAFLFSAFVFLVIGASGIRPCNLAFGADQFNPKTESGKRGINSFFNWYYFTFTFAMMVSLTVIVYVQASVNWAIGLAIPAFLMFISCAFFFVGTRIYVIILPQGSPITNVVRTLVVAFKKRKLQLPQNPCNSLFNYHSPVSINSKLAYTDQLRWLNKAAIITAEDKINEDGSAADPWNLCSVQQVEEIKCVVRVVPIWLSGVFYYVVLVQMQTYLVLQALQSDRRLGRGSFKIPAATYYVFSMISLTVWVPVYDRILIPLLRRITQREEGITMLQRIGMGLVLAILTMLVAAVVENHRRTLALTHPTIGMVPHKGAVSSMSGNWLIPQLALVGISEAFALIGQVEFYYKQFPENMRSFAGSFLFCGFAISSYFTSCLVSIVHNTSRVGDLSNWLAEDLNEGRLDYFYYLVAGLEMMNLAYFLVCAKWYRYKTIYDDDSSKIDVAMEMIDSQKSV